MPSQRRLRLIVVAIIAIIFMTFYYSGEASKIQNQKFYRSTLDAMRAKEASHAKTQEKVQNAMHADVQKAAIPPADVNANANANADADTEEIPIAGRTKMTVPKKEAPGNIVAGDQEKGKEMDSEEEKARVEKEKKEAEAEIELDDILKRAPVIVFSKSYCPYSKRAKSILLEHYAIRPAPFVVELDQHPLGPYLQALLGSSTGRRTVPNVLVNGKSIGGGDDIAELDQRDELASKVKSLGGKWIVDVEKLEIEKGL